MAVVLSDDVVSRAKMLQKNFPIIFRKRKKFMVFPNNSERIAK